MPALHAYAYKIIDDDMTLYLVTKCQIHMTYHIQARYIRYYNI